MHAVQRLLRHPYVHLLIRLPAAACKPSFVSTWWGRTLPCSTTPTADTARYVIRNPAGLQSYAPADIHHTLHQTLQPLHIHGYQLGHATGYIGPLLNFRKPSGFKVACKPTYHVPFHGPQLAQSCSTPISGIYACKEPPFSTLMAANATPALQQACTRQGQLSNGSSSFSIMIPYSTKVCAPNWPPSYLLSNPFPPQIRSPQ